MFFCETAVVFSSTTVVLSTCSQVFFCSERRVGDESPSITRLSKPSPTPSTPPPSQTPTLSQPIANLASIISQRLQEYNMYTMKFKELGNKAEAVKCYRTLKVLRMLQEKMEAGLKIGMFPEDVVSLVGLGKYHMYSHICMQVFVVCVCVCVWCTYVFVCIYVYVCVCVCVQVN